MPDVLHVVVVLQEVDETLHILEIALGGKGDVGLGDHLDLGAGEAVALLLQGLHHVVEGVGIAGDLQKLTIELEEITLPRTPPAAVTKRIGPTVFNVSLVML